MHLYKIKESVSKSIITRSDKAMKESLIRNYIPVDAVQSRIMSPTCVVDSMSNWRRRGVLLSTSSPRNIAVLELSVLRHQIEEDIINGNVNAYRIKLSDRPNGERGRSQPWIAPHQQLNAEFQSLQMNETCYVISNMEILDACIKKNEA
jgi:hypothetical protein